MAKDEIQECFRMSRKYALHFNSVFPELSKVYSHTRVSNRANTSVRHITMVPFHVHWEDIQVMVILHAFDELTEHLPHIHESDHEGLGSH